MKRKFIIMLALITATAMLLMTMGMADESISDPPLIDNLDTMETVGEETTENTESENPVKIEAPVEDEAPHNAEAPAGSGELPANEEPVKAEAPIEDEAPVEGEALPEVEETAESKETSENEEPVRAEEPIEEEVLPEGEKAAEEEELSDSDESAEDPEACEEVLPLSEPFVFGKFSVDVIGTVAPGETVILDYDIKTGNTDGAEIETFIIEAETALELTVYDMNASDMKTSGKTAAVRVSGATVQNGRLYFGGEKLKVRLQVILPEEAGEYSIVFKLYDANGVELTLKKADCKLNFTIEASEEDAVEAVEEEAEAIEEEAEAIEKEAEAVEEEAEAVEEEAEAIEEEAEVIEEEAEAIEEEAEVMEEEETEAVEEAEAIEEEIPQAQLFISVDGDLYNAEDGAVLTFHAIVEGLPEGVAYRIGWEIKRPDGDWQVIEGETGADLSVTAGEDTRGCAWRFYIEFA